MDVAPERLLKLLKIQQNIGKKLFMNGLTYQTLLDKIKLAFSIKINHQYYHLYYFDEMKRKITVNCPEDYQIFAESQYEKTLYICETTKSILSMANYKSIKQQNEAQMKVESAVKSMKEKLDGKLEQFKGSLKKKVDKIMNEKMSKLEGKYLLNDTNETHNKSVKCNNCVSNKYIIGTLYKCVLCDLNLCFRCEQLVQHEHPFFKIASHTQKIPSKQYIQFSLSRNSDEIHKDQQPPNGDLIDSFLEIASCSRGEAVKFISNHPNSGVAQLVELYFNDPISK